MSHARAGILSIAVLLLGSPSFGGNETRPGELAAQASEAYAAGDHVACGRLYAQAIEQGARFETVPFNAACCYALSGDVDRAFEFLDLSLQRGWRDVSHLEADKDLEGLRGDERWPRFLERAIAAREAYAKSINTELLEMYEADQGDRSGRIDWSRVAPRDEERRLRVREILAAGDVKSADDYYHAAMVLQHGRGPEDYELAHELAVKASELDPEHSTARWLAAAAKDRYLQSVGEPQIYGTQFRKVDGRWTLDPIDESAVTDEERALWDVPPLASAKKREAEMNGSQP
jgi:tetratricopeptide (TPR) repeat protein